MVYFLFKAYPPQCKQLEEAPTRSKFSPKWDVLEGPSTVSLCIFRFLKYKTNSTVKKKFCKQYVHFLITTVVTILSKSKHQLVEILCISLSVVGTMEFCLD